ncbi:MAG: hypothetical protein R2699_17960 [Acidimicrobiales bacterium]
MFAAELNLGAAFLALAIGGTLLAIVWVLDRKALRRELEVDEELEAVEQLHDQLLAEAIVVDDIALDPGASSVRVLGPMKTTDRRAVVEPEPAAVPEPVVLATPELEPEPELEREPELEPVAAEPRRSLPKGAEAVLAALTEVLPDPRNTTVFVRDPTAEITVHRVGPAAEERSLDELWETPIEPSGAELIARQADRSTPTSH